MLKSEFIKRLQEEIDKDGDGHLRYAEWVDLRQGNISRLLSPERKTKTGQRAYMSQKEMIQYCKENPLKIKKVSKPKRFGAWEGHAECIDENYDDLGGGAFCVQVDCPSLYDSKNVRKLINWLLKAEVWIKNKENYGNKGK
jgi:hypothetical protein